MVRGIDRYLKRVAGKAKRLDPLAPDLTRRMTALAVQDARYLRHVLKLTAGGVRREQEALQELIDGRRAQGADEGDAHIDRALRRMALLEQFGGLRHRMPAEIEVARRYIEEHYEEEVRRMAERVEARRARLGALSDALIKAADGVREALGGTDADAPGTGARVLDALAAVLADTRSHIPEAARLSDLELAALYLAQMTKDASTLAAAAPSNTIEYLIGAGIRADIAR